MVSYASILVLGFPPTALVTRYYDVPPRRLVVQWDAFGNVAVVGTRPASVLMIANIAAVVLMSAGLLLLGSSAVAAGAAVGYYASAFGLLAMAAIALPDNKL